VIRVATFNAHHADGRRGHRALVETCRGLEADILAVQELDRHTSRTWFRDQARMIGEELGYRYALGPAKHLGFGGRQCNALFTRGELDDVDVFELPRERGLELRVAVIARVRVHDVEVIAVCTHLQHRPRSLAEVQLAALFARLDQEPRPRVLLGDLNLAADVAVPLLQHAGYEPVEAGFTAPRAAPHEQIDWIAVSDELQVERAGLGQPLVSDHLPVLAEIAASLGFPQQP
jgi:endonuclease/exonuclease/phosphatase family metal-dependent hydrolase